MADQIFITISDKQCEFFRWSDDRLVQALIEKNGEGSKIGGIYLGRVLSVELSLHVAFVDVGFDKPGLLTLKKQGNQPTEGDALVVQVRRDAREEKGVRLTTSIKSTIPVTPRGKHPPALLVAPLTAWQRALEALEEVQSISCDRRVDVPVIEEWCRRVRPAFVDKVKFQAERDWLPSRIDMKDAVAEALEEEVMLPSGGKLLFEPVRTLTAIDVNSARANAENSFERTALSVNMEAAREIPRQLALRNLGGTIVIDFIDLENRNKREQVLMTLRDAAGIDSAIEWVGNMSRLGLVEISRRRNGPTLAEMWHG